MWQREILYNNHSSAIVNQDKMKVLKSSSFECELELLIIDGCMSFGRLYCITQRAIRCNEEISLQLLESSAIMRSKDIGRNMLW